MREVKSRMKIKKIILSVFFVFFCFAGCTTANDDKVNADFVADNQHCVVCLPQEYGLSYDSVEVGVSSMNDEKLVSAATVNGKPKKEGFGYYNVLKNQPFHIFIPLSTQLNRHENGKTLVYWKLNDALFKDEYNSTNYSKNSFHCEEYTEIVPVEYEIRPVGLLFHNLGTDETPMVSDSALFDEKGNVKEQEGVYYLYGVYDFEPNQAFWRTNLPIKKFETQCNVKPEGENFSKEYYSITVEIEKDTLFKNGKLIAEKLFKIDGYGYMTYGALNTIKENDCEHIRYTTIKGHELKYKFI